MTEPPPCLSHSEPKPLPSAGKALIFVEKVLDMGRRLCDRLDDAGEDWTLDDALSTRDATMLPFTLGHIGLTVRISSTRTVKAPEYSDVDCRHQGCTLPGCKGNRLLQVAAVDVEDETDVFKDSFVLSVPHHKNTDKGISQPPVTIESAKLTKILRFYLRFARPKVGKPGRPREGRGG